MLSPKKFISQLIKSHFSFQRNRIFFSGQYGSSAIPGIELAQGKLVFCLLGIFILHVRYILHMHIGMHTRDRIFHPSRILFPPHQVLSLSSFLFISAEFPPHQAALSLHPPGWEARTRVGSLSPTLLPATGTRPPVSWRQLRNQ